MKCKRLLAGMVGVVMATMLFAGCGTSDTSQIETSNDTQKQESNQEQASTTPQEKQKVQLWHYFSASNQTVLENMISEFNKSQDEVEVFPTYIARADLMKQYTMGAISGELPDIGMVDSPDMASFVQMGVFEDITDLVNGWGELDQFYEGPLSSCTIDGKIYGLPQNTNCLAIYYNLDILEANGLTEEDIPKTWDELYEVAKKCTSGDTYGFAMSAKATEEGTFTYIPWLYSAGADVKTLDSAEAIKSMEFLGKMVKEGYMSKEVVNWGQTDVRDAFIAGKAAIMQNGSWQIATLDEIAKDSGFRYGCSYLPIDQKNATVLGGENFGIATGGNKEAAFKFFEYMMGKEGNAAFNLEAGKFPIRSDAMALEDIWSSDERYKVFADSMEFAVARGPHAEWPAISEQIYTALQAVLLGEKAPDQAMKDAASTVNKILGE